MEDMTKKSSEVEMKAMFYICDSESESDTSNLVKEMRKDRSNVEPVNIEHYMLERNLLLTHLPPAAVADFQDRKDQWTRRGQSLERWRF
eukprot:5682789-Pyramimonas_sp.AAC.1